MNFRVHVGLMCGTPKLCSVTGMHTFHSYTPVASGKLYLTANVKVFVHFRIPLSSRMEKCSYFAYN